MDIVEANIMVQFTYLLQFCVCVSINRIVDCPYVALFLINRIPTPCRLS